MGKKLYPADTLKQAQSILSAWEIIDRELKIGPLSLEAIAENVAAVRALQEKVVSLTTELVDVRNQRDAATIRLWKKVTNARLGIKSVYGDDSSAYKLAGGTPRSERKKPGRKSLRGAPGSQ